MTACEYSSSCIFFNVMDMNMPKTSEFIKKRFCEGKFASCSRFLAIRAAGIGNVPDNLPPGRLGRSDYFYGM